MKYPINLTIKNDQKLSQGGKDQLEYHGEGKLYKKNDAIYLRYKEDIQGIEAAKITIKIKESDETVLIRRSGNKIGSFKQNFKAGESCEDFYRHVHGTVELKTHTDKLDCYLENGAGEINIVYQLFIGGQKVGVNDLRICFQEIE
ncbi:MAG: DUF1934 domain-containing protein [Bacillota bacterium]